MPTKKRQLPTRVRSVLGWIPVVREDAPMVDDAEADGFFDPSERRIVIRTSLGLKAAQHILAHERVHAALYDAGVTGLTAEQEEAVCWAVAQVWMQDIR